MAHTTTTVQDDPKQLSEAQMFWHSFMRLVRWTVIASVAILAFLAAAFVHF
ncbi:MAG: aa3-type cytochrome c oxidase subunit IV [Alphaproteobacteria bacterium]|nr:aa3-type cytochrome c oxidase subunit IV [Alphaproteobacteria bacterium]